MIDTNSISQMRAAATAKAAMDEVSGALDEAFAAFKEGDDRVPLRLGPPQGELYMHGDPDDRETVKMPAEKFVEILCNVYFAGAFTGAMVEIQRAKKGT